MKNRPTSQVQNIEKQEESTLKGESPEGMECCEPANKDTTDNNHPTTSSGSLPLALVHMWLCIHPPHVRHLFSEKRCLKCKKSQLSVANISMIRTHGCSIWMHHPAYSVARRITRSLWFLGAKSPRVASNRDQDFSHTRTSLIRTTSADAQACRNRFLSSPTHQRSMCCQLR